MATAANSMALAAQARRSYVEGLLNGLPSVMQAVDHGARILLSQVADPATNIRFGTWYLRSLVERFGGSRTLAIASYNAGPEAVMRWIDFAGTEPPDVFVDSVPYGETRRYLRRVLRSYHLYRLLYPEAPVPAAPAQSPAAPSR